MLIAAPVGAVEGETFAITEIDFDAGTIEIANHGDADVDPNGLIVCNFPAYAPVPEGSPSLAPGESFTVNLNDIGIPAEAADGEMGLYLNNEFENSESIVAYVEWGSTGHRRAPVAQGAEVWDGTSVDGGASVLSASAAFPTGAAAWQVEGGTPDELPFTGFDPSLLGVAAGLAAVGAMMVLVGRRRESETRVK